MWLPNGHCQVHAGTAGWLLPQRAREGTLTPGAELKAQGDVQSQLSFALLETYNIAQFVYSNKLRTKKIRILFQDPLNSNLPVINYSLL